MLYTINCVGHERFARSFDIAVHHYVTIYQHYDHKRPSPFGL